MANMRRLRQLSLNCESPTLERRKSLKKQFSEDLCEVKEKIGAKIKDRPRAVKIAWADEGISSTSPKEEGVIAKKCIKEVKKAPKLSRHSSLEKESILYSKQELADRLRQALKQRVLEKPNLNIFLAHNTNTEEETYEQEPETPNKEPPKIISPLLAPADSKNAFQMRKSRDKPTSLVVVPHKEPPRILEETLSPLSTDRSDPKAIKDVIIRPATAAAKRERFQRRNTVFNAVIKEGARPPLVRSSSAPTKVEVKPKFLATKRKIKSGKVRVKTPTSEDEESGSNKENPKSKKEMNRYVAVNGTDIVTMVSLISPAASDTEEPEPEPKPKTKTSPSKPNPHPKDDKDSGKNVSLRKTVKSVSFQSSSIHAIRSFSASFPARRGSMATALILANGNNGMKNQKNQEKRGTNSVVVEDEERGPKRRLVRSATDKTQRSSEEEAESKIIDKEAERGITVKIKEKIVEETPPKEVQRKNPPENIDNEGKEEKPEIVDDGEPKFGSVKEKECWDMYCKMADKGLKVSYDTILRGMLTPTEYRMRRKESIAPICEETAQKVD